MQSAEEFVKQQLSKNEPTFDEIDLGIRMISARDAEWQARVDTLLEDNARSEEQVKKQFATAVNLKARAEKAEARVEKLEAALETVQPYFCDPLFHEEHLKRWPMKNRCPTCGLFVADWDAIRAALGRIA